MEIIQDDVTAEQLETLFEIIDCGLNSINWKISRSKPRVTGLDGYFWTIREIKSQSQEIFTVHLIANSLNDHLLKAIEIDRKEWNFQEMIIARMHVMNALLVSLGFIRDNSH